MRGKPKRDRIHTALTRRAALIRTAEALKKQAEGYTKAARRRDMPDPLKRLYRGDAQACREAAYCIDAMIDFLLKVEIRA